MTYSIVARDQGTGQLGVAVQSHYFGVGQVVSWARPGIGAVATQSFVEPAYGPRLLDRLAAGEAAAAALTALLAEDDTARHRQVAVIGAAGSPAVHTGAGCIAFAGDLARDSFSVQANMMASDQVWSVMAAAYEGAAGLPLARRLLAALDGGERAGGDVRGRQSAALIVVPAAGEPWQRDVELRVEDHPEPLEELRRLLTLHDAYAKANEGDDLTGEGRHREAGEAYRAASALAPDNQELLFWAALAEFSNGDREHGLRGLRHAIELHPAWLTLLSRLEPDIAPGAQQAYEALREPRQ